MPNRRNTPDLPDVRQQAVESLLADASVEDVHGLLAAVMSDPAVVLRRPARPELRRPPLDDVAVFRLRVDLDGFRPPIWRRLEIRSDTSLDVVHRIVQEAFGWWDVHLHRFALGGSVWDHDSEVFLCPLDADEGDDGTPEHEVRLDETLQEPGDRMAYVYDYGDEWALTLRLEKVLPDDDGPAARCTGGRRAAPPEDSRGEVLDGDLAAVVDDPDHFDPAEVDQALAEMLALRDSAVPQGLVEIVESVRHTPAGAALAARVEQLSVPRSGLTTAQKAVALRGHLWFLEHAASEGLELTSAGYLRPADVEAASAVVPTMADWVGTKNREAHCAPLLDFRELLQAMKLLRKYKGRLKPTRLAAAMNGDPEQVWDHLVSWLQPDPDEPTDREVSLLMLVHAATADEEGLVLREVAELLALRGYTLSDGSPVRERTLLRMVGTPWEVLRDVGERPPRHGARRGERLSPAAQALARDALLAAGR